MTERLDDTTDARDYAKEQANRVKEQANRMKENAQNIGNTLSDSIDDLKQYAHHSGAKFRSWVKSVGNQANNSMETIENTIRSRPILSATAAFAVGMLASKLITNRK